jgi:putative FmdB family regulatory protein
MPTYDYACGQCGPFEAFRRMQDRDAAAGCPRCEKPAGRVYLGGSVPTLGLGKADAAHAANMAAAQGAYARMRHGGSCGCCT